MKVSYASKSLFWWQPHVRGDCGLSAPLPLITPLSYVSYEDCERFQSDTLSRRINLIYIYIYFV